MRRSGRLPGSLFHPDTIGCSDRYTSWVKALQATYIDAERVRCNPLAVERIDSTDAAKIVSRGFRVKLISRQRVLSLPR